MGNVMPVRDDLQLSDIDFNFEDAEIVNDLVT